MTDKIERRKDFDLANPEGTFIERLGENLGVNAHVKTVFGDPIQRQGVTIVPVASVYYGFGGGGGKKAADQGGGGGGGARITPVGYIEMKDGASQYHAIKQSSVTWRMVVAGFFLGTFVANRIAHRLH